MNPFFARHKIVRISLTIMALSSLSLAFSSSEALARVAHPKHHRSRQGAPVAAGAKYADIVIDGETGRIIHATNPVQIRHPASLTKMMTLYLTFQAIDGGKLRLDQRLWVSQNASEQSPTKLGLRPGQSIRVEDAILGLVTESANDAAVVLAEALGGSEERFAQMMTRQAHVLGMTRTTFQNPSGLPDPEQVTCAADMARLGYALIYHYPRFYAYFSTDSFVYAGANHHNHNHLMERYDGMDGIKTGYIRTSGFNLVASAVRNQTRLIGVVFGGKSAPARDVQMENLLDESFAKPSVDQQRHAPVVLVGQTSDDPSLTVGDYLPLPAKVSAVYSPAAPGYRNQATTSASYAQTAAAPARDIMRDVPAQPVAAPVVAAAVVAPAAAVVVAPTPTPVQQQPVAVVPNAVAPVAVASVVASTASGQAVAPTVPGITVAAAQPAAPVALPAPVRAEVARPVVAVRAPAEPKAVAGNWAIQIGAYTDPTIGKMALSSMSKGMPLLQGAAATLQQVSINNAVVFRARFLNLTEKTARDACATIVHQRKNCLVVRPVS